MYKICMAKLLNLYIHDDNQKHLKNVDNQSALINDLLRKHFETIDPNKMSVKELEKFIEIEKIKQEYKKKMEVIQNGH